MTANQLARLAVSCARLENAISTARASGDFAYVRTNQPALDDMREQLDQAVDDASPELLQEARELTNAPL